MEWNTMANLLLNRIAEKKEKKIIKTKWKWDLDSEFQKKWFIDYDNKKLLLLYSETNQERKKRFLMERIIKNKEKRTTIIFHLSPNNKKGSDYKITSAPFQKKNKTNKNAPNYTQRQQHTGWRRGERHTCTVTHIRSNSDVTNIFFLFSVFFCFFWICNTVWIFFSAGRGGG